jgi:phosphoserine phosphatase RsbU/P
LYIDTERHKALYSAAGHPAMLLCRAGELQSIESNGMVFGVVGEPEYPVFAMEVRAGDRILLYTDGVIEAENAKGVPFGPREAWRSFVAESGDGGW